MSWLKSGCCSQTTLCVRMCMLVRGPLSVSQLLQLLNSPSLNDEPAWMDAVGDGGGGIS